MGVRVDALAADSGRPAIVHRLLHSSPPSRAGRPHGGSPLRIANEMARYFQLPIYPPPPTIFCKCGFYRTLSPVFLDLRIVNELRSRFSELRIQGLALKLRLVVGRQTRRGERRTFELLCELTQAGITYW